MNERYNNKMKIGIITLYYNNANYGGQLQAYALQRFLTNKGYNCEQIQWDFQSALKTHVGLSEIRHGKQEHIKRRKFKVVEKVLKKVIKKSCNKQIEERKKRLKRFEEKIPHSNICYDSSNFQNIAFCYDAVVVGSDQIWNMQWYCPEHFLDFKKKVKKISYAASMPDVDLTEIQKETIKKHLLSFDAISVREVDTVDFLNSFVEKKVCWMPDPTFLLKKEEWEELLEAKRMIQQPYIFCYFLGEDKYMRKVAKKISKKTGYPIVTLPHLTDIQQNDSFFGKVRLYDIGPEEFLHLIYHAEYVFTDSFHATVFSLRFQTRFLTFSRYGNDEKNSRIKTLLALFSFESRLIISQGDKVDNLMKLLNSEISDQEERFDIFRKKAANYFDKYCHLD